MNEADTELQTSLVRLAEPPHTHPHAVDLRLGSVAGRRRQRRLIAGAGAVLATCAIVAGSSLLLARPTTSTSTPPTSAANDIRVTSGTSTWGVYVGAQLTFDVPRTVEHAVFQVGGESMPAEVYTSRYIDTEPPHPLPVAAGDKLFVQVPGEQPACGTSGASSGELEVRFTLDDGSSETASYNIANISDINDAIDRWCASAPHLHMGDTHVTAAGSAVVHIVITNAGSSPIEVRTPGMSSAGTTWLPARITVDPSTTEQLTIRGTDITCDTSAPLPWTDGNLTVDGTSTTFEGDEQWC